MAGSLSGGIVLGQAAETSDPGQLTLAKLLCKLGNDDARPRKASTRTR